MLVKRESKPCVGQIAMVANSGRISFHKIIVESWCA